VVEVMRNAEQLNAIISGMVLLSLKKNTFAFANKNIFYKFTNV